MPSSPRALRLKRRPWVPSRAAVAAGLLLAIAGAWWTSDLPQRVGPARVRAHVTRSTVAAPTAIRYPEARAVPESRLARLRALLPDLQEVDGLTFEVPHHATKPKLTPEAVGPDGGVVLVRALLDRDAKLSRHVTTWQSTNSDADRQALAWYLREHPTPLTDRLLMEMLRDPELHVMTRISAAVALCRPGNAAAMEPLADVVLDVDCRAEVRGQVLYRLQRLGLPLPPRVRGLLEVPFHGLDRVAALVLAVSGDFEAPSLVLEALRESAPGRGATHWTLANDELRLALEAAQKLAAQDAELSAVANTAAAAAARLVAGDADRADDNAAMGDLVHALAQWLDTHPAARATAWERARTEYLASDRRARELALRTVEDFADAPDEDVDVAAAAVLLMEGPGPAAQQLEELDRLARWLRPQVERAPTPRAKLDTLQRLLVPQHQVFPGLKDMSSLSMALRHRAGICMTWTLLFVALGDRLGLPLHGVDVPGHVFVRWDDGTTRLNFDPSAGGTVVSDEEYARERGGVARLSASGRYLRNLTRKELVSLRLSNAGWPFFARRDFDQRTIEHAEHALRIDPENPNALVLLSAAYAMQDPPDGDQVLRCAERIRDLPGLVPDQVEAVVRNLCLADRAEDALAWAESAVVGAEFPSPLHVAHADALCAAGRHAEARPLVDRLLADKPKWIEYRALRAACALAGGEADAWERVSAGAERADEAAAFRLALARRLLDDLPRGTAEAQSALRVLDGLPAPPPPTMLGLEPDGGESLEAKLRRRALERIR